MITVFFAIVAHTLIIIGVRFEAPTPERINKSLQIALVNTPTKNAPEEADFLAQQNQIGSGRALEKSEPKPQITAASGQIQPPVERRDVRKPKNAPQESQTPRLTTPMASDLKVASGEKNIQEEKQEKTILTAAGLSHQIALLGAEIEQVQEDMAKRPRIKFINSVNAHRYKAAAYEKAWQDKVERVGNLNYPDEARRKNLSGSLLLAVGIKQDGTIYSIKTRRSSGHKALDDGAIRIVRLAAPFAPFPSVLSGDADVLVITRTWKFSDDSHMTTSR